MMDVNPTDLMILFDDFDEIAGDDSSKKSYHFYCARVSETAELTIFPGTGTLSLNMKSDGLHLYSLNLVNCDRIVTNLKKKKLYFTSGFEEDERFSYIECMLDLNDNLFLSVEANARPWLRGLG